MKKKKEKALQNPSRSSSHIVERTLKELNCREEKKTSILESQTLYIAVVDRKERWCGILNRTPDFWNKKLNRIQIAE